MRSTMLGIGFCAVMLAVWAAPNTAEAAKLETFVSIPPQAYLVERIGGRHVGVGVLVKPGQEPHTFEPTPRQIMALGRARLYFAVDMPFEERLVEKIRGIPTLKIVDTAKGVKKRRMRGDHEHAHHGERAHEEHGHEPPDGHAAEGHDADDGHGETDAHDAEREHEALDPHIWLSPPLLKIQARNIADALTAADPAHAEDYAQNLARFIKDLDAVDARIRKLLKPFEGEPFYVFHPAFGYFGDAYGLRQEAVELEGKSPTPRRLGELIAQARGDGVHIIFVQPQFNKASAQVVADAIDGAVVPMDPLARDVLKNLQDMASSVNKALGGEAQER